MTLIPFTPNSNSNTSPFTTILALGVASYVFQVAWNVYRGDWYFSLTDQSGNPIINQPLIASPPDADIYLAPGLFPTSTIVYRPSTGNIEIGP